MASVFLFYDSSTEYDLYEKEERLECLKPFV